MAFWPAITATIASAVTRCIYSRELTNKIWQTWHKKAVLPKEIKTARGFILKNWRAARDTAHILNPTNGNDKLMKITCPHCKKIHDFNMGKHLAQQRTSEASKAASRLNGQKRKAKHIITIKQRGDVWDWKILLKRKTVAGGLCGSKADAENDAGIMLADLQPQRA